MSEFGAASLACGTSEVVGLNFRQSRSDHGLRAQPYCTATVRKYLGLALFATFLRQVAEFDFDVMLEAKVKDFALARLRPDLLRYAPDVAERYEIQPSSIDDLVKEEQAATEADAQ